MTLVSEQQAALEPVRAAMLRRAAAEAESIIATARRDAAALVAGARREAEAAEARARADGMALAAPLAAAERSRGRRAARAALLAAQRGLRDETESRIRAAILGLRDQPGYGELRDRLAALARAAAGPGAAVSEHPRGGVIARAPGVLVDCSLPRLAERVIRALGPQIRECCAS
jgi:vacuolar-type H+-ATPase subunit E/Vma4